MLFRLTGAIFPSVHATSTSVTFSSLDGVQSLCSVVLSTSPAHYHLLGGNAPPPNPEMSWKKQKIEVQAEGDGLHIQSPLNIYRGPEVMTEQRYLYMCMCMFFILFFRKILTVNVFPF